MKKKLVMMLFFIMACSIIASGCGKKKVQNEENVSDLAMNDTVNLKLWGGKDDQELLTQMVESFKAYYASEATFDITVEIESESTCKERVLGDVTMAADVFTFADDQLRALVAGGAILPVDNEEVIKAANTESSIEAASVNDRMYAYPMTADNGYFMFYNKAYFTEEDVKSFDKMLEVAAASGKKVLMDWSSGWYLYSFFGSTGLTMQLSENGVTNVCNWNAKEGTIKGIDVANAMLSIASNPGFLSGTDDDFVSGIKDGTIIAGVNGIWNSAVASEEWGENYGAVKLPTYTCAGQQVQMASYAGYKMVGVSAYSKESDWAMKLADWITNEENQKLRFVERAQGPSNINAADSEEVRTSPAIKALIDQSEFASLQRVGGSYWEPVQAFGEKMATGKVASNSLQKLLDTMVAGITSAITEQ